VRLNAREVLTVAVKGFPRIIGHRGASAHAPENTLRAFVLALEAGATGIECDVHLTADGQIVVLHDDLVDATTNGHGPVATMTLAQVRALNVHSRGETIPIAEPERIPTLAEVLDSFGRPGVLLNIEIKPTRTTALAAAVARAIAAHPATPQVLLSSFDVTALTYLHSEHPHLRRALLYPPTRRAGIIAGLLGRTGWIDHAVRLGCEAVHPFWQLATEQSITHAHTLGLTVNVWTVDAVTLARQLAARGVDGIITNDPAKLRSAFAPAE